MENHQIVCGIAAFSFLSSAAYMCLVRIPHPARWKMLVTCRTLLMMVFLVVGLSCVKNVFFPEMSSREGIIISTLISASIQSLLFLMTSVTFINPNGIKSRFVWFNAVVLVMNAAQLLACRIIFPSWFMLSAGVSVAVYLGLWTWYQSIFRMRYREAVASTDLILDEYSETHFKWVKFFFINVSVLGLTACAAPFCSVAVYDVWMLMAALCYGYVVVIFVRYFSSLSTLVSKTYVVPPPKMDTAPEAVAESGYESDFATLEHNLEAWVDRRGFVQNDLVSEDLARQLGVSIVVFRAYFKEKDTDFRQWRLKKRIEYACEIIKKHPDYSYDTIADLVGIGDRSNFNKAFKRIMGITPREYSKALEKSEEKDGTPLTP